MHKVQPETVRNFPRSIMDFEIFDKETEKNYRDTTAFITIDAEQRRIRFTVNAVDLLNLKGGGYIKFLRFKKCWYVVVTDKENGFWISVDEENRSGGKINNATTGQMILRDLARNDPKAEFYLHPREYEFNGHLVYELVKRPAELKKKAA
jgi:hypothetical protein